MCHYANNSAYQFPSEEDFKGRRGELGNEAGPFIVAPRPGWSPRLSLLSLTAVLRAGHGGVAEVTSQTKTLSPKKVEGLAQHHHGAEPRQKFRVSH